jgi:hypothetical protein
MNRYVIPNRYPAEVIPNEMLTTDNKNIELMTIPNDPICRWSIYVHPNARGRYYEFFYLKSSKWVPVTFLTHTGNDK